jgi:hypothetical protein
VSARRRAKVVRLPTPPAERASTEDELALSDLAGAVWFINCGVGTSGDTEKLWLRRQLEGLSEPPPPTS